MLEIKLGVNLEVKLGDGSKTGSKNSALAFINCMDGSVLAFLKCTDGSVLAFLKCTDGSVLVFLKRNLTVACGFFLTAAPGQSCLCLWPPGGKNFDGSLLNIIGNDGFGLVLGSAWYWTGFQVICLHGDVFPESNISVAPDKMLASNNSI